MKDRRYNVKEEWNSYDYDDELPLKERIKDYLIYGTAFVISLLIPKRSKLSKLEE